MPKLVVIEGPTTGLEFPVKENVILGRDPRCQVLIAHREVSAQHARITRAGDRYFLEDLRSRNGTFLNEQSVQRQPLEEGDQVRIGRTIFRFELRGDLGQRAASGIPFKSSTQEPGSITIELDAMRDVKLLHTASSPGARRLENVLKLLSHLSRSIGAQAGLKSTLDEIASTLLEIFPLAGRAIILLSADGVSVEPLVSRWRVEPPTSTHHYSETVVHKAMSERRAILTIDAQSDERFSASRSVLDLRLRSLMCVPIVHRDRVLGAVELDTVASARMFGEEDLNLMSAVVAQVALAVGNAQLFEELQAIASAVAVTLTTALGARSPATLAHCERVSRLAAALARRLELTPEEVETVRLAGLLHDIGLIAGPDRLLRSREEAIDEREILGRLEVGVGPVATVDGLRGHPELAAEMLSPINALAPVVAVLAAHHERFDGRGYPRGLSGLDIPLGARLLCVADAFDALTAPDYEGPSSTPEAAIEALRAGSGRQFDPELVIVFEQSWSARRRLEARRQG